jgi:predicted membrane-bound spermidine synthase
MSVSALNSRSGKPPAAALAVFFASGFAALLYQVIWQRMLVIFSGVDIVSVTTIVAAFMAGLGAGSLAGGVLADRLGPRPSLWAFCAAELGIGVFALISKPLYYDVLYAEFSHLAASAPVGALLLFVTLLVPTSLMGLSLPPLVRALTGSLGAAGTVVGALYGWNTLGAAVGAFVSTWGLLPRLGLEHTLRVGAALNVACAVTVALMAQRSDSAGRVDQPPGSAPPPLVVQPQDSFATWMVLYGLSGFIALAFEIVWFRLVGVMLKSTAFTFGTLLGVYLSGLGAGAAVGARLVSRSRHPGLVFLAVQYGATVYAALTVIGAVALLGAGHPIKLVRFLAGNEPADVYGTLELARAALRGDASGLVPLYELGVLYLVIPIVIIAPATFLMGFGFPFLQKASHARFDRLARGVGLLLSSNIAGCLLGVVAAGWLLLPMSGTAATLKVLVGLGAIMALPVVRKGLVTARKTGIVAAAGACVLTAVLVNAMPDGNRLWARLHGAHERQILVGEDGSGLSLLKSERPDFAGNVTVFVSGLSQSWIPYGNVHTALGALPALVHPRPRDVLVIGLGSGDTAFAAAARPDVQRVVCIELIAAQRRTLERLAALRPYRGLLGLLRDPRIEHRVGDGRAYLQRTRARYDIIEADALRPSSAHSGNLYSVEYFNSVRRRLQFDGLAVTWAPTERIRATFLAAFPHVLALDDIYVGSGSPIPFDARLLVERAASVRPYFEAAGVDIVAIVEDYLGRGPVLIGPDAARPMGAELNTDMFPRDEFALPF